MSKARWLWVVGLGCGMGAASAGAGTGPVPAGAGTASCGSSSFREIDPATQRLPQKDEGQAECCRRASTLSSAMHTM